MVDFENAGISFEQEDQIDDSDFENAGIDMFQEAEKDAEEPSWLETIGDIGTQATRGALKFFTWPLDVLKISMIGEGLADIDEIEQAYYKHGKPFDREEYVKQLFKYSDFAPTQELAEKGFEELTGISLNPKTGLGKSAGQVAGIAAFTPGKLFSKLGAGLVGAGTTQVLKSAGVGEGTSEFIGDVTAMSPQSLVKQARQFPEKVKNLADTAQKHALPFIEAMTKENMPFIRGRLRENTAKRLKDELGISSKDALNKILTDKLEIKKLQDKGINLNVLAEEAYEQTLQLAKANPQQIKTTSIADSFQKEIDRIKSLAPSPTDAQKEAIMLLERERDIMKVSNPTAEQLVQQHINYNADMKQIYRKPEFSGKEDEVRKTYEFMKDKLLETMETEGHKETAKSFKAANKIYHEKSKLEQSQDILDKAFTGDKYDPNKLNKILNSKKGKFLKRNLGKDAIKDIEEIAQYGQKAEENMSRFMQINNKDVQSNLLAMGKLAPFLLIPHTLKGAAMSMVRPMAQYVQGKLLTRPATREIYKMSMKHAAEGAFNLLKKDMVMLENKIIEEYGSIDDFIDSGWDELNIYQEGDEL